MVRRSAGFVSKKPHRKSRGGCLTCKRKKVKCDEAQPACGYCCQRRLDCEYIQDSLSQSASPTRASPENDGLQLVQLDSPKEVDFNDLTCQIPSWIMPAVNVATGRLSLDEVELLHHYRNYTWQNFTFRGDEAIQKIHQETVPQLGVTQPYLLTALLSVAASHRNSLQPSKKFEDQALVYRQKTFQSYTKELQNITSENYETILLTSMFTMALIPYPGRNAGDDANLEWLSGILKLSEGLRILAGLRWSQGIEKLSIYPLMSREVRTLPPPPVVATLQMRAGPLGSTPEHPNPPSTYGMQNLMPPAAGAVFLPPPLMALLEDIEHPPDKGPIDMHHNTLYPVFHVLSPTFLSLYYYHLNPDFNVRTFVISSFLMPDFLALVKAREPRALVLVAWWFALMCVIPKGWWLNSRGGVVRTLSRVIRQSGDTKVIAALEGAVRIVDIVEREGVEKGAESIFEGWEGVNWEDGPRRAEEWERGLLVELGDDIDFAGLDLDLGLDLDIQA